MTIKSDAAEVGQKEINKHWPNTEGLTAGTTITQPEEKLEPEDSSNIKSRDKELL